MKSIGLLNFEGDVFKVERVSVSGNNKEFNLFRVVDYLGKEIFSNVNATFIIEVYDGMRNITTSDGKTYNIRKEHPNAKPKPEDLLRFLGLSSTNSIWNKKDMKKENDMSLCERAHKIVNERDEEKDRMYGPFSEGMDRAAQIFSGATGIQIEGRHMYIAMIALKLSRQSYNHKQDNLLDAIAYIQGLENYENDKND